MDRSKMAYIVLIPAYQPTHLFLKLLKAVKDKGFKTVVVNDGSSAEKADLFRQAKGYAVVLEHNKNLGKGQALKTGLNYIKNNFSDNSIVVTMDADGQHKAEDALKICRAAEKYPNNLILGSRKLKGNTPFKSRFGNMVTRFVYSTSTGLNVYDTQTGLRAFSFNLISEFLQVRGERYEYEMNVLLECSRKNIPIMEIEIETIYIDGNSSSHFNAIKDSYCIYKEILKFSASSFSCFIADYVLYSFFSFVASGIDSFVSLTISNVGARIISAGINYTVNRRLVFKSKTAVWKSALQYFALAAAVLAGNTLVLNLLVNGINMNKYAAKLCTEMLFFAVSWFVQRRFVFSGGKSVKNKEND